MKKLFLIRHCETNQFEEGIDDHQKQLTEEGQNDAKLLSEWLSENQIKFNIIYSSSAKRALDTSSLLFDKQKEKIVVNHNLYLCNSNQIIKLLKNIQEDICDIALVGHEPSISDSLKFLVGNFRPDLQNIINLPYPAGGIAIIFFNIKSWKNLDEKTGVLDAFIYPNYLKKNEKEN